MTDFFDDDWEHVRTETNVDNVDVEASVSFDGFSAGSDTEQTGGETSPSTPADPTTGPTVPSAPSGKLGFPESDTQFMQSLEVRGVSTDGHRQPVETVYALIINEGHEPRIVALHEPEMYEKATNQKLHYYVTPMADEVARQCSGVPDAVIKFHTHPNGSTTPSSEDRQDTESIKRTFEDKISSDDFEFIQGIHAYKTAKVPPEQMRHPTASGNCVSWNGEAFRHELAFFDAHFIDGREVSLI